MSNTWNKKEYRIKEHLGVFTIQVFDFEEKGMLWWKRKEWKWYRADIDGRRPIVVSSQYFTFQSFECDSFKTLEDAEDQVRKFQKGIVYHRIESGIKK